MHSRRASNPTPPTKRHSTKKTNENFCPSPSDVGQTGTGTELPRILKLVMLLLLLRTVNGNVGNGDGSAISRTLVSCLFTLILAQFGNTGRWLRINLARTM
ncbi:hypothetical protein ACLKA6_003441 [Drosophila palustris]